MSYRRLRAVARKEVLHIVRDPRSLASAIAIPLMMLVIFSYALSLDVDRIPTMIYDLDQSPQSRELIQGFRGSRYFQIVGDVQSYQPVEQGMTARSVLLGVVIPANYSRDLLSGSQAQVQLLIDGSDSNTASIAQGYAEGVVQAYGGQVRAEAQSMRAGKLPPTGVGTEVRVWYNPDMISRNFIVPGLIAVIMMIITGNLSSLTISREWENGTMEQLLSTPVRPSELALGKLSAYFLVGLVDMAICMVLGIFVFDVPFRGSLTFLILSSFVFLFGALCTGILISAANRTQLMAYQLGTLVTFLPGFLLSGFIYSINSMPPVIQVIALFVPARYFINITKGVFLKGTGIAVLWPDFLLLCGYGALMFFFATRKLRERWRNMRQRLRAIIRKEFIQALRDPRMRSMLILPPLIQLLVFGYAVNLDVDNARIAWMDQDHTPQSRELLSQFEGSGRFVIAATPDSESGMQALLDRSTVDAVVRVLPGFGRDVARGRATNVQVLLDGTNSNTASLVSGYATQVVARYSQLASADIQRNRMVAGTTASGGPLSIAIPQVVSRSRVWFNPDLRSRNYFIPGVVVNIITLVTLSLTAMAIVREKEIGTMEQLMVTPIRPVELILGKTLPFVLVGYWDLILVVSASLLIFHVPFNGSFVLLLFAAFVFLLTTLGAGLFISTISRTQQQAMMATTLFFQPFFMLSGFTFPIRNMPEPAQWLTYINPVRYFMEIVRGVFLQGAGLSTLWPQVLILAIFGVTILGLSVQRFHKQLE